jgi:hypothetical protein
MLKTYSSTAYGVLSQCKQSKQVAGWTSSCEPSNIATFVLARRRSSAY